MADKLTCCWAPANAGFEERVMDLLKEVRQAQIEHGRLLATLVGNNDCSCKTPMTPTDLVSSPFKTYQNLKSVDSLLTGEVADAFVSSVFKWIRN